MISLPRELDVFDSLRPAFTSPTHQRFVVLALGCILAMGRRTVSRVLWAAFPLASGHPSSYHRFFSAARWSIWTLARVHAAIVLELVPPEEMVFAAVDDTVALHRGKKVYGKGWHRDAVRSSRKRTLMMLGHKWVVLTVNVRLPLCRRPWALPVLAAL